MPIQDQVGVRPLETADDWSRRASKPSVTSSTATIPILDGKRRGSRPAPISSTSPAAQARQGGETRGQDLVPHDRHRQAASRRDRSGPTAGSGARSASARSPRRSSTNAEIPLAQGTHNPSRQSHGQLSTASRLLWGAQGLRCGSRALGSSVCALAVARIAPDPALRNGLGRRFQTVRESPSPSPSPSPSTDRGQPWRAGHQVRLFPPLDHRRAGGVVAPEPGRLDRGRARRDGRGGSAAVLGGFGSTDPAGGCRLHDRPL